MKTYYYLPVWMSILIDGLIRAGLARRLKHTGETEHGMYTFTAPYGDYEDKEALEETLVVWNAGTKEVQAHLYDLFPDDVGQLVRMAEEYAVERAGRKETYVCRCIVQLLLAKAAKIFSATHPNRTLIVTGDFGLVGRFPDGARLRINGNVEKVEGATGQLLKVQSALCPKLERLYFAQRVEGVWTIVGQESNSLTFPSPALVIEIS